MKHGSLDHGLAAGSSAGGWLYSAHGNWSIDELRRRSLALRERATNASGGRIVLCGLKPIEFIEAIVAFDGFAEALLLLPSALDSVTQQELIQAADCTHQFDPGQSTLIALDREAHAKPSHFTTRWLLATSGTTGKPKLIEHTLASLTRTVKRDLSNGSNYHWGLMYDPSRFAGLQVVLQALLGGSNLTVPGMGGFEEQVQALLDYPVNALSATPTLWRKLMMDGRILQLSLRQISIGGEIADQAILNALRLQFPSARVTHIYASTEAGTGFSVNDGQAGFPVDWLDHRKGPILLRINSRGHLLVKPPILPTGAAVRARLDEEGYLDTEDQVSIQDGRVIFHGRASGAINVGGNKVNPEQVEQILRAIPGIQDAKVYPQKSSVVGQLVAADVIPEAGMDVSFLRKRISEHCRLVLETWQTPAIIRFVHALSVNAAGKVERQV